VQFPCYGLPRGTGVANPQYVPNIEAPIRDADDSVRDELARFEREMKRHKRKLERSRKIMEARGRIMVMLMGLARYEPQYEGVKAIVEDQWQSAR
jgi:hypothetical protein